MPDRRTFATFAAVGVLAAALFVLVIEFVAGSRVILGLGWYRVRGASLFGLDRVYVVDGRPSLLPLVPVALGAGLLAGLIVAVVAQVLHATRAVLLPLLGAVVGALLALGAHLWRWNRPDSPAAIAYHGRYVPLDDLTVQHGAYTSTLDTTGVSTVTWWPLVLTGAAVGLVVGALVAVVTRRSPLP